MHCQAIPSWPGEKPVDLAPALKLAAALIGVIVKSDLIPGIVDLDVVLKYGTCVRRERTHSNTRACIQ